MLNHQMAGFPMVLTQLDIEAFTSSQASKSGIHMTGHS
jgi:hypothetical protein